MDSPRFWDCHTHVQFAAYDADRDEVVKRARAAGVSFVNVGSSRSTSEAALRVAEEYDGVYAVIGLHPIHTSPSFHDPDESPENSAEDFDYAAYRELALHPKNLAIGECGLDYFRLEGDADSAKRRQKEAFDLQSALAKETGKPLMIHCREAFPDLIAMLRERRSELNSEPGIIHFFTGGPEEAAPLLDLGFSFTFGGTTTFPPRKGQAVPPVHETVRKLPADRILSETDAPYVSPVPYRGQRNEPAYVVEVVRKLAELRGLGVEEMAETIDANARRVFRPTL